MLSAVDLFAGPFVVVAAAPSAFVAAAFAFVVAAAACAAPLVCEMSPGGSSPPVGPAAPPWPRGHPTSLEHS